MYRASCVARHILVILDDTLRAIAFCLQGGGEMGGMAYPDAGLEEKARQKAMAKVEHTKKWLDMALKDEGIAADAPYHLSQRERAIVNAKIKQVNRWCLAHSLPPFREIVVCLAMVNMAVFFLRCMVSDSAALRMVYIEADRLCLLLGSGEDWLLSADLFACVRKALFSPLSLGMSAEEEEFFILSAMPCPRSETEEALFTERGQKGSAAEAMRENT